MVQAHAGYNREALKDGDTSVDAFVLYVSYVSLIAAWTGIIGQIDGSDFYTPGETSGTSGRGPLPFQSPTEFVIGQEITFDVTEVNGVLTATNVAAIAPPGGPA